MSIKEIVIGRFEVTAYFDSLTDEQKKEAIKALEYATTVGNLLNKSVDNYFE